MHPSRSPHATHDRLLIANLIDRTIDEAERMRAEELLAACRECEQLHDDLVTLSAATKAMVVPARPREFTLTEADADRLRVRGWRRVLAAIGSSRDVFSRPLALGLTTLGVAGLLVATVPTALSGLASGPAALTAVDSKLDGAAAGAAGAAAAGEPASGAASAVPPGDSMAQQELAAAPSSAASGPAPEALTQPSEDPAMDGQPNPDGLYFGSESTTREGESQAGDVARTTLPVESPGDRSSVIIVAGALLLTGLGLFLLRWAARRLGDG